MIHSTTLPTYTHQRFDGWSISIELSHDIKQWCYILCLPLIGLLALICFLSLGGAFAMFGPWILFAGIKVLNKHWDDKS